MDQGYCYTISGCIKGLTFYDGMVDVKVYMYTYKITMGLFLHQKMNKMPRVTALGL